MKNIVFRSCEEVLTHLKQHQKENQQAVSTLLSIYNNRLIISKNEGRQPNKARRFPLIVMEGLDGSGKTSVSRRLGEEIGACYWSSPPRSVNDLQEQFNKCAPLRTSFYTLSNYIVAIEVERILARCPVILDRYWHSTSAFAMAQAVSAMPDLLQLPVAGDLLYKWPSDLLKPNIVVFLNVSEEIRKRQVTDRNKNVTKQEHLLAQSDDFRNNVLKAYQLMHEPSVTFVNADVHYEQLIPVLLSHLRPSLVLSPPQLHYQKKKKAIPSS